MATPPKMSMETLEERFHGAMLTIYRTAKSEANYAATRFLQMVEDRGGLETAKHLLDSKPDEVSEGFVQLALKERLDLTVESLVLQDEWKSLFSSKQLKTAQKRLTPSRS